MNITIIVGTATGIGLWRHHAFFATLADVKRQEYE